MAVAMVVDAHQHIWDLGAVDYPWLNPEYGPLYRTFEQDEVLPQMQRAGVERTVLVQAADNPADTAHMLAAARRHPVIAGVVAWAPLDRPDETASALDGLAEHVIVKGIRHLIQTEPDPDWLLQPSVREGLRLLAERDLAFDIPAVLPRHLEHVPVLAEEVPALRIVIDHLAKPPIKDGGWEPWASLLRRAAEPANVFAKVSGLNTAADLARWTADDLQPYVDHAIACFGADRLMFGSDWPVALLAGDYQMVRDAADRNLAGLSADDRAAVLGGTANRVYRLGLQ